MRRSIGSLLSVAAAALLVSFVVPQTAHAQRNQVSRIQHSQMRQIRRGVREGNLTRQQGKDLAKQERDINALKTQMNKNGTPSKMDKAAMQKHLTQQERDIRGAQKMNNSTKASPTPVEASPTAAAPSQPPL